ncbi:hypothetical protein RJT34_24285 [Clitoria ternatea]|uniref:Methyltransferase n=1 Tax=Clitoria ternatea TaxID=43366 RepID=A0AAN9FMS1_CLITE
MFLGFLYVYRGSIFGSKNGGSSALEYGSKSLKRLGATYLGSEDEADGKQGESSSSLVLGEGEDAILPKSFPLRLKLDLSLMEHYERHCPPAERRYNCLIPPPPGYKSRDEAWKANIPHTHLAHEKSDQNWMVVKGDKIVFPGGGTHFHYGADKYIASIANVRLIGYPYKAE